jgi:3',5'-cyclic AMP phosphodiesterase CpdA
LKFAVLGDLHINSNQSDAFIRARRQVAALAPDEIVCLGDLGDYGNCGTRSSFIEGREFLSSFGMPYHSIVGNHDLECLAEFSSDVESVSAFCDVFDLDRPYRTMELGNSLGILLSSTGYRDNVGFRHEVSIDDEQVRWLSATLRANPNRNTIIFSHSPPLGSQLRVLQALHLRSGNAWLNQSNDPGRFSELLAANPQVRLWFSGHNHLGQHYSNSISQVGRCLFIHTGVIGEVTRDGERHSRFVEMDSERARIETVDHRTNRCSDVVTFDLETNRVIRDWSDEGKYNPEHGAENTGNDETKNKFFAPPSFEEALEAAVDGNLGRSLVCTHRGMLLEYDRHHRDPVGVVEKNIGSKKVRIADGQLFIRGWMQERRISPNRDGYFFAVPNANATRRKPGGAR